MTVFLILYVVAGAISNIRGMMSGGGGADVCVVCNSDAAEQWPGYILEQAASAASSSSSSRSQCPGTETLSSRTLLDSELSRPSAADTLRSARVVVVIVSHGHCDYLARYRL